MQRCPNKPSVTECGALLRPQARWALPLAVAVPVVFLAVRGLFPSQSPIPSEPAAALITVPPAPANVIRFGIVPQQAPSQVFLNWSPLAQRLSQLTGMMWLVETAPSIPEFEGRLAAGVYDVAYMNPYHYVVFSEQVGYRAFAREKEKRIQGILVVHRDSPFQDVADLEGVSAAFPAPAAFAASVLTRSFLRTSGVNVDVHYVTSHDSVYHNVANGVHAVGGGVIRTFKAMPKDVTDQLRILWTTPQYTPHAFAYHPRLPAATAGVLLSAVDQLNATSPDVSIYGPIGFSGLTPAVDSDWEDVRALGISELTDPTPTEAAVQP